MKTSPVYQKELQWSFAEPCYDPEEFSKFLEEARKHAGSIKLRPDLSANASDTHCVKRKKSWKKTLSFLWGWSGGKSSGKQSASAGSNGQAPTLGLVSGPIVCGEGRGGILRRRPAPGPLGICFTPTMAEETETAYVMLGHVQGFGPIYRVT